jgi:glycosyltransferase involved in cell wall biosynthesis
LLLSIIIPAYNEISFIDEIIKKVKETPYEKEVIVVDDYSTDGTREYLKGLKENSLTMVFHEKNLGKGAALRNGIAQAKGDVIIIQDADLEYDPKEYPRLLGPILDGKQMLSLVRGFLAVPTGSSISGITWGIPWLH